jgi:hypothetical protein
LRWRRQQLAAPKGGHRAKGDGADEDRDDHQNDVGLAAPSGRVRDAEQNNPAKLTAAHEKVKAQKLGMNESRR